MSAKNHTQKSSAVMPWVVAIAITLAVFYGLDHFVMGIQGLPLNWDLSPAQ
ncbi:MAG: hypothetical protein V3S33_03395 [Gammaproteobacteria bacterium]